MSATSYEGTRDQGTNSFVAETGRDKWLDHLEQERAALVENGQARAELVERVNCAVCGCDSQKPVFNKGGFEYVKCACGLPFINPQLTSAALDDYYSKVATGDGWLQVLNSPAQVDFDTKKFAGALDLLEREVGSAAGRSLVDIGCGSGLFIKLAAERGLNAMGIEPSPALAEFAAANSGCEVVSSPIEQCTPDAQFDLASLWEVLEHTKDPRAVLNSVRERMQEGGTLMLLIGGNADSLAMRVMRQDCTGFEFGRLWYFGAETITRLLADTGFKRRYIGSIIPETDTLLTYLAYEDPYRSDAESLKLEGPLVDQIRAACGPESTLGYKLLVLADAV